MKKLGKSSHYIKNNAGDYQNQQNRKKSPKFASHGKSHSSCHKNRFEFTQSSKKKTKLREIAATKKGKEEIWNLFSMFGAREWE
jgi:hypothetical protein